MNAARWLAAAAGALLALIAGGLVSEEVRGRLDRVPFAVLRLARTRLPAGLRERVHDQEWVPELEHILKHAELLPLTRLITGLRYAAGLLMRAGTIASALQPATGPAGGRRSMAARSAGVLHALFWPVKEPLRVRLLLAGAAAAAAAATGVAAADTAMHARDLELSAILMACGLAAQLWSPRHPRNAVVSDLREVWLLPAAILLPPVYALIAPAPRYLVQWHHPAAAYRRTYTLAVQSLTYGAISGLAHAAVPPTAGYLIPPGATMIRWAPVIIACGLLAEAANEVTILAAIKTTAPATRLLPIAADRIAVRCTAANAILGTALTIAAAVHPLLAIPVIPAAVLLARRLGGVTAIATPAH